VENMNGQAVESWLLRMMRHSRATHPWFDWTFYCALGEQGRFDESIRAMGGSVILSPVPLARTIAFTKALHHEMKRGHYDVLHAHHDIVSAVYLIASLATPIRRRVVHIHNTSMDLPTPSRIKRSFAWEPMRQVCIRLADRLAGISHDALSSMLRGASPRPGRDVVVYYGVDTGRFTRPGKSTAHLRPEFNLEPSARIILFAGRMTAYKNPVFVVRVLADVLRTVPEAIAVFAGAGPEISAVERAGARMGISGIRRDGVAESGRSEGRTRAGDCRGTGSRTAGSHVKERSPGRDRDPGNCDHRSAG
jgi:glycosyltransferase involved in cell wall biosynthesis